MLRLQKHFYIKRLCSADILFYKNYSVSPIVSELEYIIQAKNSRLCTLCFAVLLENKLQIKVIFH